MDSNEEKIRFEQQALRVSMWGAILFVILEFFMALITHSQAVLMDSAYDAAELVTIIISLRLVPLLYKPLTEKRPFGYAQVETWFLVIKGFMLVAITVGLVVNNIQIILQGGRNVNFTLVAYFELFAAVLGILIVIWLRRMNHGLESPMVLVEINGWWIDTIASIGMACAFFLPAIFHWKALQTMTPYLDQIVAIILTFFILPTPIRLVVSGMNDLFLMAPEQEVVDQIKKISDDILQKHSFGEQISLVTYDIMRMGRRFWISIYVTPKKDIISISKWSSIQLEIELALMKEFNDVYVELLPEIE